MDSEIKSSDLRDASFAYLTAAQQNYVYKLTESAQNSHPDVTLSFAPSSLNPPLERPAIAGESEISVFGAEKYFKMKLDDDNEGITDSNVENFVQPIDHRRSNSHRIRAKGKLGTPSVSSVSSLNSQTALLRSNRPNLSHMKKANERWLFPVFSCTGSCSDGKSIDTNPKVPQRGQQVNLRPPKFEGRKLSQSKREDYLVLPTVNSGLQSLPIKREKHKSLEVEDPRKSLEVFGSHVINKEDIESSLERKLSLLSWDAIPYSKVQMLPSVSSTYEEDPELAESEASSDLFEIENISCSTQPAYTKKISDEMSGYMTPKSETSVEWSVVTASAADFSFVSECDEKKKIAEKGVSTSLTPKNRRPNGFLGCTSQKSVGVVETVHKRNEKGKPNPSFHHQRSLESSTPARKLSADHSVVKSFHIS